MILDVLDGLLQVVEPGGEIEVDSHGVATRIANSTVRVDHNGDRPFAYEAGHLYGWAEADTHLPDSAGPSVREDFVVRLVLVAANEGEEAEQRRHRALTAELDARGHLYLSRLAANRSRYADGQPAPWGHVAGVLDHEYIRAIEVRGLALVVTGYRRSTEG